MADLKITTTVDDIDQVAVKVDEVEVYPAERDPVACAKIAEMQKVIDAMSGGYILDTFTFNISHNQFEDNYNCMDDVGNLFNHDEDLDGCTRFVTKPIPIMGKIGCINIDMLSVSNNLENAQIRLHYYNGNIHKYVVNITLIKNGQVSINSPIYFDDEATHIRIEGFYILTGPASKPILKYIPSGIEYYKKSDDAYLSVSNAEIKYQSNQKISADVVFSSEYENKGSSLTKIGNTVMLCLCADGQGEVIGSISDDSFKPTEIVQQRIDSTSVLTIMPNGNITITGTETEKAITETITYLSN